MLILLLSGDVETNPGPAREKKPDPKKVMEDKVNSHDEKIAALEQIVKEQREFIKEMRGKQVELESALENSKVEFEKSLEDKKVLAANLDDLKVKLSESNEKRLRKLKDVAAYNVAKFIVSENDIKTLNLPKSLQSLV